MRVVSELLGEGRGGGQQVGEDTVGGMGIGAQGDDQVGEVDAIACVDQADDRGQRRGQRRSTGPVGIAAEFIPERAQRAAECVGVAGVVVQECSGETVGPLLSGRPGGVDEVVGEVMVHSAMVRGPGLT